MAVAVVTDSTAALPAELAALVSVVPLTVIIDEHASREGIEIAPAEVARALATKRVTVTTSRPSPAEFAELYRQLFAAGCDGIVSVHLSAALSGTVESATMAAAEVAAEVGGPIEVVDSRSTAMGLGFPALAAAEAARSGGDIQVVRLAAVTAVAATDAYFVVDTLDHLRRGGRIGAASALLGTALSVKPILHVEDGTIISCDRVRTVSRALDRLVELALAASGEGPAEFAVHHLDAPERAERLVSALRAACGDRLGTVLVSEVSAVIAAHVGPGVAGIVVHRG